ncbi:hypothetical protein BO71DRAFT_426713 [Aspergillus ellipticus CBS 707.79]|uniref:Uncharacterized protein n=1 Tax=Aspergillus ellipticus CBS 707.79 TaxID=1448320 RepID=A0A319DK07_9EURO|nr:hypothetical protein BO71DRAFT_426713 [Aspergillus ellipticus CBS 707.79]
MSARVSANGNSSSRSSHYDYVFYGADKALRAQVFASIPPPMARGIAEAIKKVIGEFTEPGEDAVVATSNLAIRAVKRPRVD